MLTNTSVASVPPPVVLAEQGPLALVLQTYPGKTWQPEKSAQALPESLSRDHLPRATRLMEEQRCVSSCRSHRPLRY